jgi:uncharacterized protein YjbI with pentapeptide repeats
MKTTINGVEYEIRPNANLSSANLTWANLTGAILPDFKLTPDTGVFTGRKF